MKKFMKLRNEELKNITLNDLILVLLLLSSVEYVYMNNHSIVAEKEKRIDELLNAGGFTLDEIEERVSYSSGERDGIFSPVIQLSIIGLTLACLGVWFSVSISYSMGLIESGYERVGRKLLTLSSIFLSWLIIAEVIIFFWRILK